MKHTLAEHIEEAEADRVVGHAEGPVPGPRFLILGGMHGNEPAGVEALQQVFGMMERHGAVVRGTVLGLRANLPALREGVRYIDEDMNRIWFPRILEQVRGTPAGELDSSERRQIKKLLPLIGESALPYGDHGGSPDNILVDLHSFSAEGHIFAITAPRQNHVDFLSHLHVPMVFGIEESLRGAALRYFQDRGYLTYAFEGGQHRNDLTVDNTVAALLLALSKAGIIDSGRLPDFEEYHHHLRRQTRVLPVKSDLVYQHIIQPGDRFRMRPDYRNFQPVKEGEWLASDREGRIVARCDGYLLMPLYQNQGNDGFFIVRART
ncbi:MAG: succinylglutamate desuccinylase/aspartoacylase family protein [Balneolaceae bacterium]|nr:succinylglutamate desuccinylase/aspartoacylase family protein [Balneolaceae bacterium]